MAPSLSQIRVYIAPLAGFMAGTSDVAIFEQMATEDIAKQISVSWAWEPADTTSDDGIFLEFAAQGQTVFVASGDDGAWVTGTDDFYPAEDAYVTAVGGTLLTTSGPGGTWTSEIAWGGSNSSCTQADAGSGGGASPDNIPIPLYQQLAGVANSSNFGSTILRNAPDVAAEANCDNYYCANGTCWQPGQEAIGGTSLAAPTWAGFMALANQQAVANGGTAAAVGGLNPPIYAIGAGPNYSSDLHDITIGDNYTQYSPSQFPAVLGYDLATGWGSPNGQALIQALQPMPIVGSLTNTTTTQTVKFGNCTNVIRDFTWTFTDQAGPHNFAGSSSLTTRSGGPGCGQGGVYGFLDEWSTDGLYCLEAMGGTGSVVSQVQY